MSPARSVAMEWNRYQPSRAVTGRVRGELLPQYGLIGSTVEDGGVVSWPTSSSAAPGVSAFPAASRATARNWKMPAPPGKENVKLPEAEVPLTVVLAA